MATYLTLPLTSLGNSFYFIFSLGLVYINYFGRITVPSQAFLDVTSSQNPALSYGAEGLLGLGFTSLSSIDSAVNATGSSKGRSLLYNLFEDNPSEPNFIAFSLQRASDSSDTVLGNFSIG
jgi:saccharopepsin